MVFRLCGCELVVCCLCSSKLVALLPIRGNLVVLFTRQNVLKASQKRKKSVYYITSNSRIVRSVKLVIVRNKCNVACKGCIRWIWRVGIRIGKRVWLLGAASQ